jgi:F420-non-reducing hydrogenase iron-sulfur subunit
MSAGSLLAFVCNYDALSCLEALAQKRQALSPQVKFVRVSCLSRVHSGIILDAFRLGAEKVILLGCERQNCHFGMKEELAEENVRKAQLLMHLLGLPRENLALSRLPHGDADALLRTIKHFAGKIDKN